VGESSDLSTQLCTVSFGGTKLSLCKWVMPSISVAGSYILQETGYNSNRYCLENHEKKQKRELALFNPAISSRVRSSCLVLKNYQLY